MQEKMIYNDDKFFLPIFAPLSSSEELNKA